MTHQELESYIERNRKDFVLIDVRSPQEFSGGHIPKAINIPLEQLTKGVQPEWKDKEVVLYCLSGGRSSHAMGILKSIGFSNLQNFGGISQWQGPLEKN